ncbi:MAG: winged helix-turn-helix domain-containing protein [Prevotella sp.]|nr:winged helix-turn-helix domain-containing protein [Prevotella sp.]
MAEKKATTKKAATPKAEAAPKKAAAPKKTAAKKVEVAINAENVGFKAGDVYQALAAAGKALSVADIAKKANIAVEEAYLGIGWLFKEGKVRDDNKLITLA